MGMGGDESQKKFAYEDIELTFGDKFRSFLGFSPKTPHATFAQECYAKMDRELNIVDIVRAIRLMKRHESNRRGKFSGDMTLNLSAEKTFDQNVFNNYVNLNDQENSMSDHNFSEGKNNIYEDDLLNQLSDEINQKCEQFNEAYNRSQTRSFVKDQQKTTLEAKKDLSSGTRFKKNNSINEIEFE